MIRKTLSDFTSCIVTLIWADGINRTKPVLFTYDKRFRFSDIKTPRRKQLYQRLQSALVKNGLVPEQVILLEGTRKYVGESSCILRSFLETANILPESIIFHDQGHAFKEAGQSVIEKWTSARDYTYPPPVHQFISPNDCHLHGAAKAKWRSISAENGWGPDDAVESELCLL